MFLVGLYQCKLIITTQAISTANNPTIFITLLISNSPLCSSSPNDLLHSRTRANVHKCVCIHFIPLVREVSLLLKANYSTCAWIPSPSLSHELCCYLVCTFSFLNLSPLALCMSCWVCHSSHQEKSGPHISLQFCLLPSQILQMSHICFPFPSYLLFRPMASAATIHNTPC